jgi:signal transduction histidine kinase
MIRLTARARLTLLLTGLVFGAGVVLTTLTYLLLARSTHNRWLLIKGDPEGGVPTPVDPDALPPVAEKLRDEALQQLLVQSAIALAVVTVLSAVTGWLVAGRILRPVRVIASTARRLSATNLTERVPVDAPPDELTTLAGIINDMLDRIQLGVADRDRLLESQRMFVANAAHELRTPLTTMRTAIDVTLDGQPDADELTAMAVDVRHAAEHAQRTLDGLLTLARSHTGPTDPQPVDLADLAAEVLGGAAAGAARAGVEVHDDLRPAPTTGEPVLLERMVSNLVDNALRYNHAGGHVTITTGTENGRAVLRIGNTGPRVPDADTDRLFEPFVRATPNRISSLEHTGLGLGLSIVRAVVIAHHGVITAAPGATGGLGLSIALPPADPPPTADRAITSM